MDLRCCSLWLLLQLLGQFLLVVSSSPANKTIRIGYLLDSMSRAGAINVAIERAQNDGLLRDYNFRYAMCNLLYSVRYMTMVGTNYARIKLYFVLNYTGASRCWCDSNICHSSTHTCVDTAADAG